MRDHERGAVVGGARTPFATAGTVLKGYTALELAVHSVEGAVVKLDLDPGVVDHLVYGIVTVDARVPHLAREVCFASRLPASVRAVTVTDNCITAITAVEAVYHAIASGRSRVGVAGGVESLSNPSLLWSRKASRVFSGLGGAKTPGGEAPCSFSAPSRRLGPPYSRGHRAVHRSVHG